MLYVGAEFPGEFDDSVVVSQGARVAGAGPRAVRGRGGLPQQQHRVSAGQGAGAPGAPAQQQPAATGETTLHE